MNICRLCGSGHRCVVVDLGMSPLSNSFVRPEHAGRMEPTWPLVLLLCEECRLVQLDAFEQPEAIFGDYPYFSSVSASWRRHAAAFVAAATSRFGLGPHSQVVEVASNDGYLLQPLWNAGIPALGIEPAANVAAVAQAAGLETVVAFFGRDLAAELREAGRAADLLVANNVLAHVPDIHDVLAGFALLLKPGGVLSVEVPHLLRLVEEVQFDTIYHEHLCYFSLRVLRRALSCHGLRVFDVEELPTHGGSLRVLACHEAGPHPETPAVAAVLAREAALEDAATLRRFAARVAEAKCALLRLLLDARAAGRTVAGYGAPAKGNTLLNYCGVGPELLPFTVDRSPAKQGTLLPGSRIPVHPPGALAAARPDVVLILPWNIADEVRAEVGALLPGWRGRFAMPIPCARLLPP